LAALLEGHSAFELKEFVATARGLDPASQAECVAIAGGTMAFVEPDSLVNQAIALGLVGPVTEDDVRAVEGFYRARRARASVCVCPLAHPSLIASLAARGWVPEAFEHVLVRRLTGGAHGPDRGDIVVHEVVTDEERDAWALAAATGFSDPLPPQPQQLDLGRIVVRRPGARLFLAFVDGRVAGTGELHMRDGVAWLSGDATLTHFRRRGVQSALQRHRLDLAAQAGCELAVTESTPGSGSQRNMERLGFRIAYTRVDVIPGPGAALRPAASHEPEAS
jgi:GNAT superfamily N-acetyltransferase